MSLAPDTVEDVATDLARGLKLIQAKSPEYRRREEYYQGGRKEIITHPKLRRVLEKYGDAFHLNYASVPCDALMDRVDLMSLTAQDARIDAILRTRLWEPNSLDDDADDIHLHASYLGDYYVVAEYITDTDVIDDETDEADGGGESGTAVGTIELTPKHPDRTIVVYQRSNSRIPDFAVQMIEGSAKGAWTALVYYDDETWEFDATEAAEGYDAQRYDVVLDDQGEPDTVLNDVTDQDGNPLFPVFHFRPDRKPYGLPINSKMYGPQDAITKINATQLASMDYYGFPQRYRVLALDAETDDDIDDDFNDDGTENADTDTSTGSSRLSSDPGGMWELPGGGSVGQFNPADPKGFLDPLQFQIRAGATLSRTPLYEFDLDGSGDQPSGEARRRADGPITKHAGKVKGQFGTVWSAIGQYALAALGQQSAKRVEAVWAPSETSTDTEGIALVGSKIKAGVPPRQALLEAGYTQEQVDTFLPIDVDNGMATPLSPDLIVQLASALQSLGQAENLGSVDGERIRRIFRFYFGDIAGFEPAPTLAVQPGIPVVDDTQVIADKADALGKLVRAGVRQEDAARILGITGVVFDGEPVALRDSSPTP